MGLAATMQNSYSEFPALDKAYNFSHSRMMRLREAGKLVIATFPKPLKQVAFLSAKATFKCLKFFVDKSKTKNKKT